MIVLIISQVLVKILVQCLIDSNKKILILIIDNWISNNIMIEHILNKISHISLIFFMITYFRNTVVHIEFNIEG